MSGLGLLVSLQKGAHLDLKITGEIRAAIEGEENTKYFHTSASQRL